jgi:predicted nucleic acid-binding protein
MGIGREIIDEIPEGATLTFDTAPIIYFLEDHARLAPKFAPLFDAAAAGRNQIVLSVITLAEVLSGPLGKGNEMLAARYRAVLCDSAGWQVIPVSEDIAVMAARLRSSCKLRLPDAIQVATAVTTGSYALITYDRDFSRVSEIRVLGS